MYRFFFYYIVFLRNNVDITKFLKNKLFLRCKKKLLPTKVLLVSKEMLKTLIKVILVFKIFSSFALLLLLIKFNVGKVLKN